VHQLVTLAFTDPIPAAKPLGFRFTVGGGKKVLLVHACRHHHVPLPTLFLSSSHDSVQVRAKYGEEMTKWCREALRAIGFEEDR
jgi:hypothetical protein